MALPDRKAQPPDRKALAKAIEDLLLASGAELDAETRETPGRVAKAFSEDLLDGYARDPVEILKSSLVPAPRRGELVIASQIDFHAMCPHHLLPYKGSAAVGYVADQWLVGFGKIAEATDALAHRLILQEQLVHRLCESVGAARSSRSACSNGTASSASTCAARFSALGRRSAPAPPGSSPSGRSAERSGPRMPSPTTRASGVSPAWSSRWRKKAASVASSAPPSSPAECRRGCWNRRRSSRGFRRRRSRGW